MCLFRTRLRSEACEDEKESRAIFDRLIIDAELDFRIEY